MQKTKTLGVLYIIILNILSSMFLFTINHKVIDVVINIIMGLLGLYIFKDLVKRKRKLSEILFILSIYNLMITGSMFFSTFSKKNKIIDNVSLSMFIISIIIMLISLLFISESKPYHVKQFTKWSIYGVLFATMSIFSVVLINEVTIYAIKMILIIICAIFFILMFFALYKIQHYKNKM